MSSLIRSHQARSRAERPRERREYNACPQSSSSSVRPTVGEASLEEFREAEEQEGFRYELAEGVLEVTEVPGPVHRRVVGNLYRVIARYDRDHPGVIETFGGGAEFRLWIPSTIPAQCRLGVVLEGSPADAQGRTQPTLVAEVVSRGSIARTTRPSAGRTCFLVFGNTGSSIRSSVR